ncbi:hypothetical protein [Argonema antarcticum]|uniref:hypothetical protein n=1 Tax=Argonema antarcticum TaxID=2942763 RepID=UPI002012D153|nr:hypothetical protein [Argonema antarcticum]MCL1474300.1 hypothetical protein [Argonema antarcticum A004/B2]
MIHAATLEQVTNTRLSDDRLCFSLVHSAIELLLSCLIIAVVQLWVSLPYLTLLITNRYKNVGVGQFREVGDRYRSGNPVPVLLPPPFINLDD